MMRSFRPTATEGVSDGECTTHYLQNRALRVVVIVQLAVLGALLWLWFQRKPPFTERS